MKTLLLASVIAIASAFAVIGPANAGRLEFGIGIGDGYYDDYYNDYGPYYGDDYYSDPYMYRPYYHRITTGITISGITGAAKSNM
ncbi:hypothetical protein [Mesorhizobium sp. CA10]|uniref:hypothetical protein n=1 Tax=Mesorhizobium sp. CA10 TaxID=588495 RepID=UPI002961FF8F|nr:hypothetical protein [Mesorhizobium sp. CA10]